VTETIAKTLSVPDAGMEYFGLSRNAAYAAAKRGDLPTIRIGKLLRVPVVALEAMLNSPIKTDAA
jgi:Helix-turn-helix domain